MSSLVQLFQGSKSYGSKELFQKASFSINESEHVGVIGPNGAGKTTLFKILVGEEELDEGDFTKAQGLRIGYLKQHDHWKDNETVEEFLSEGCQTPIWTLKALGRDLGLSEEIYHRPISALSGGYRMRCKLLHLLGEEPDLLLLDEPTNYLDLESLLVLERFLQGYKGAFLLISHDQEFLRKTTDHILEVESGDMVKYNGSLDDYFEQKELLRTQLESRALSIEQKRKEVLDFVARFGAKATKASQAQSRLKSLDRLEKIEIKALPSQAVIHLPEPTRTGKQILTLKEVDLGYENRTVLKKVSFSVERGSLLAVVGTNGAGKSTFLKALAGRLEPLRGSLHYGHEVSVGYYAQHVAEALNPEHTVLQAIGALAHASVTHQQILNIAGALLFSGDAVSKKIAVLSGGEKSRVALGQILLQKAPCLLLDEPTNHLDFQTVEALTQALSKYEGTVVVVSHDRNFIRRIATKVLEVHRGMVEFYPGTYEEYVWSCQKGALAQRKRMDEPAIQNTQTPVSFSTPEDKKGNWVEEKKTLEKEIRKIDRDLLELDAKVSKNQIQMKELNDFLINRPEDSEFKKWIDKLGKLQNEVEVAEAQWLGMSERKEEVEKLLEKIRGKNT